MEGYTLLYSSGELAAAGGTRKFFKFIGLLYSSAQPASKFSIRLSYMSQDCKLCSKTYTCLG